ncbi:hypothetical protein DPMN_138296 [Dreissena polymorpha]|uniref:Uncharacterized protein n=1 Tax=Dreissena polymorpha TaxID=45954 RepID=A0A9D4JH56_DREPO|nr:hypothetical protein DPMN_138296 [Dreissena polymorpha]
MCWRGNSQSHRFIASSPRVPAERLDPCSVAHNCEGVDDMPLDIASVAAAVPLGRQGTDTAPDIARGTVGRRRKCSVD